MNDPCTTSDGILKKKWATLAAAKFVAEWDELKHGGKRRVYRCPKCRGWHTTSVGKHDRLTA